MGRVTAKLVGLLALCFALTVLAFGGVSSAQYLGPRDVPRDTTVAGVEIPRPPGQPLVATEEVVEEGGTGATDATGGTGGSLPRTGQDATGRLAGAGLALVLTGGAAVMASRRRRLRTAPLA